MTGYLVGPMGIAPAAGGGGGGGTTTLNPLDRINSTLDGTGLIATNPSGATYGGVRSIASYSTGKKYMSMVPSVSNTANDYLIGIATSAHGLNSGPDATSAGMFNATPNTTIDGNGGTLISGIDAWGINAVVDMAVDIPNRRLWFRINNGLWNNNAAADPVGNVGGADISYMSPPFYVWIAGTNSSVQTVNFGATTYTNAAPAGYTNW